MTTSNLGRRSTRVDSAVAAEITALLLLLGFWVWVWIPGVLPTLAAFLLVYAFNAADNPKKGKRR